MFTCAILCFQSSYFLVSNGARVGIAGSVCSSGSQFNVEELEKANDMYKRLPGTEHISMMNKNSTHQGSKFSIFKGGGGFYFANFSISEIFDFRRGWGLFDENSQQNFFFAKKDEKWDEFH